MTVFLTNTKLPTNLEPAATRHSSCWFATDQCKVGVEGNACAWPAAGSHATFCATRASSRRKGGCRTVKRSWIPSHFARFGAK